MYSYLCICRIGNYKSLTYIWSNVLEIKRKRREKENEISSYSSSVIGRFFHKLPFIIWSSCNEMVSFTTSSVSLLTNCKTYVVNFSDSANRKTLSFFLLHSIFIGKLYFQFSRHIMYQWQRSMIFSRERIW